MLKKWWLWVGLVLIAGVALVVFRVLSNLDSIVASMVEESGTQALHAQVSVGEVSISLSEGKATIAGLTIANPSGYSQANLIELDSITVDLDLESIGDEVIILEAVNIGESRVSYEIKSDGSNNMQTMLDNIEKAPADPDAAGIKLIIDQLNFSGSTVTLKSEVGPIKEQAVSIPGIKMRDVGKSQGGATPEAIARDVGTRLAKDVISAATRAGVEKVIDEQKDKLKDKLGSKLKNILDRG